MTPRLTAQYVDVKQPYESEYHNSKSYVNDKKKSVIFI